MPIGHGSDPDSARGIISRLGENQIVVAARGPDAVLGCILGAILTPDLIQHYGLRSWDAKPGDGFLAFIGIATEAQGSRVGQRGDGRLVLNRVPGNPSLARCLFERWLKSPELAECPSLFIRTRRRIGAVRHLIGGFGFSEWGRFPVDFRGQQQYRLVYRRAHKGFPVSWNVT